MASNEDFIAFQQCSAFLRHGRLGRTVRRPARFLWSKALEILAHATHRPINAFARTFWGDRLTVVFPDRVSTTLYRYGFFERELTRIVLDRVSRGMVFFDVGSHIGYFSLLARHLVGSEGQVHSFEPTPSTFAVLRQNMQRFPNAVQNNLAAYSHAGVLEFRDFGVAFSAFNSLASDKLGVVDRARITSTSTRVPTITLDEYVRQVAVTPHFIKIDAEGAELEILRGMPDILRRARPMITLEVGDKGGADEVRSRDVVDFIMAHEYAALEFAGESYQPHQPRDAYEYGNLLFVPRESASTLGGARVVAH
jgi:FkbM family methyltransferase